ncbi:MAG: hypothetical protein K6V97_13230 [Actinomycetia bacterium]|nr:hypothetical protein [Actinomycetes bacterium]
MPRRPADPSPLSWVDPGFLRMALALAREEAAAGAEWFWPERLAWLAQTAVETHPWGGGPAAGAEAAPVAVAVVVAIVDGRRVWLLPGPGGPRLPDGPPRSDEGLAAAVRRVAREATGWAVAPGPVTGLYHTAAAGRIDVVVRAAVAGGRPTAGAWYDLRTAGTWAPGAGPRAADALAFAGRAVFRSA